MTLYEGHATRNSSFSLANARELSLKKWFGDFLARHYHCDFYHFIICHKRAYAGLYLLSIFVKAIEIILLDSFAYIFLLHINLSFSLVLNVNFVKSNERGESFKMEAGELGLSKAVFSASLLLGQKIFASWWSCWERFSRWKILAPHKNFCTLGRGLLCLAVIWPWVKKLLFSL